MPVSMKNRSKYSLLQVLLPLLSGIMLLLWVVVNAATLFGSQNGIIRSTLSLLFGLMILLRPKSEQDKDCKKIALWLVAISTLGGIAAAISGIVMNVHQVEWIGIILLLFACLSISLPNIYARDIPRALFILYWLAPLPNRIFTQLQLFMQSASVAGSAWLLQLFNIRVWGDGLVLRTGVYTFEIPAWCSGMRTATTVFILSLAIGILRRMRPREITAFTAWSLFHALILNIIRISIMVIFAPHTHSTNGLKFLHDSAGIVVIGGVLIVYLEMIYLENRKRWQHHVKSEINQAKFENISEFPPFWKRMLKYRKQIGWTVTVLLLVIFIAFKSRPYHRAMMIGDVVNELRNNGDLDNALRGASVVSGLIPNDIAWKFSSIRLHIIAGQHQQAVDELEGMENIPEQYRNIHKVLLAYSLLYLGKVEQAAAIVNKLPENIRDNDPRVAMIMAEMALRSNDSEAVAVNVVNAANWAPNLGRIRNLYPYLHVHRKWKAMVKSDIKMPYNDPVQAFSILEACMQLDRTPRVADITLQVIERWPTDMRALEPLYFMAIKRGNKLWHQRFAEHLLRAIKRCNDPIKLYETMYKCFSLKRPDLAWQIYRRIQQIDPHHPTLPMSVAKYGQKWFIFNKTQLDIPASLPAESIDLRPFFILGKMFPKWSKTCDSIPLGEDLCVANTTPVRKRFLTQAIRDFRLKLDAGELLSLDMQYLYALALEMNSRIDLARQQLSKIEESHPEEKENIRIMMSEMYERKGDWVNVYETLRTYLTQHESSTNAADTTSIKLSWPPPEEPQISSSTLHLKPLIRLTKAQIKLKMNLSALHTAQKTEHIFPYSTKAIELYVTTLMQLGYTDDALQILEQPRLHDIRTLDILEAKALAKTERFSILPKFCRKAMLPQLRIPPDIPQQTKFPPAELVLLWHKVSIPSEEQFCANNKRLKQNLSTASPGLHRMLSCWITGYETHCAGKLAAPQPWIDVARDPVETAVSLNQLTLLLCRDEKFKAAKTAAQSAVAALPSEPILWQILISLSNGDIPTIELARHSCPDAPRIWLAELVAKTHPDITKDFDASSPHSERWLNAMIDEAIEKEFPAEIITRAGEYLWRNKLRSQAIRLARDISPRARGLLPAYVFAMHCAIYANDKEWAIECTSAAIKSAINPLPEFYRNFVTLKTALGKLDSDTDMVDALRNLRKSEPNNPIWAQLLGYIRFERGGWEIVDAMFQMQNAIENGATNAGPYLVAAEASRLLRNYDRSIDILEQGLKQHPNNLVILNNLAFTMASSPKHAEKALKLLPALIESKDSNPSIYDTIAVVYLNAGELDKARKITAEILNKTTAGSPGWFRAKTHLAQIAWKQGDKQSAIRILNNLLKNPKQIPDEDILNANTLLANINNSDNNEARLLNPIFDNTFRDQVTIPPLIPEQKQ